MATATNRPVRNEVERGLTRRPGQYSFFHAVRQLELLNPKGPRVGELSNGTAPPILHFAQVPHLYSPPSEIFDYSTGPIGGSPTMQVFFFGLFGPGGALPLSFTEYVHTRGRRFYDLTMQRFADIFHDRLLGLYYRAGTRAQQVVSYDRERDALGDHLSALAGLPDAGQDAPLPPQLPAAYFRELLTPQHPDSIRRVLGRFFGFPVRLQQAVPCRLTTEPAAHCLLGRSGPGTLGRDVLLGESCRSISEKVLIHAGPIPYATLEDFLPGGCGERRLRALLQAMEPHPLIWELRFRVITETIPPRRLNGTLALGHNACLPNNEPYTVFSFLIHS
ncbi:MAG: type VI secretion system baseplate subunit TssG [Akkermansia muciniphila]|nr:type VI secretion system baseplate subunit TssG [Akkermansia muciniphila]